MKHTYILLAILIVNFNQISAQSKQQSYLDYISRYSDIAVEQQKRHGIPASIKLAQGLLESGAGYGELARVSNNHFGIKCTNWTGEKVYSDDDKKGECFRKYDSVRDSYEDHSSFLTSRSRYAFLFALETTDYKGWANGLMKAGYATDPNYANKLIKLIEDYDLSRLDGGKQVAAQVNKSKDSSDKYKLDTSSSGILKKHSLYRNNGVKCVFAEAGDTYASIAAEFNLSEDKILFYNDLAEPRELSQGTVVYIGAKKKKAAFGFNIHKIKEGESLYFISQKYGIRLQSLYDLNNLSYDKGAVLNMVVKLK